MKTPLSLFSAIFPTIDSFSSPILGNKLSRKSQDLFSTTLPEQGDSYTVSISVPGLSKDDLQVYIVGRELCIGTKAEAKLVDHHPKSKCGNFNHSFLLPGGIDPTGIRAKCRNGLLTITIENKKKKKNMLLTL